LMDRSPCNHSDRKHFNLVCAAQITPQVNINRKSIKVFIAAPRQEQGKTANELSQVFLRMFAPGIVTQ
jgi:hypothetical protein